MNWRRGLLRAWVLFSVIWIVLAAAVFSLPSSIMERIKGDPWAAYPLANKSSSPGHWVDDKDVPVTDPALIRLLNAQATSGTGPNQNLIGFALFGLLPPLGLLAFGAAGMWVARGFHRPKI